MIAVNTYLELLDVVWDKAQHLPAFNYEMVAQELGITRAGGGSQAIDYGIRPAVEDLIKLRYCVSSPDHHRIVPASNPPKHAPSTLAKAAYSSNAPKDALQAQLLRLVYKKSLTQDQGIIFYMDTEFGKGDLFQELLPNTSSYDAATRVTKAVQDLEKQNLISAVDTAGAFIIRGTLPGACWIHTHP